MKSFYSLESGTETHYGQWALEIGAQYETRFESALSLISSSVPLSNEYDGPVAQR